MACVEIIIRRVVQLPRRTRRYHIDDVNMVFANYGGSCRRSSLCPGLQYRLLDLSTGQEHQIWDFPSDLIADQGHDELAALALISRQVPVQPLVRLAAPASGAPLDGLRADSEKEPWAPLRGCCENLLRVVLH